MVQQTVNLDSRMLLHVSHAVLGAMPVQLGLQVAACALQALSALLVHSRRLLVAWVSTVPKAQPVLHSVLQDITVPQPQSKSHAQQARTAQQARLHPKSVPLELTVQVSLTLTTS